MPMVKTIHENNVHLRERSIQTLLILPDASAPTANANGTVRAIQPIYNVGG